MSSEPLDSPKPDSKAASGVPHVMLAEIDEQPRALERTLRLYLSGDGLNGEMGRVLESWVPVGGHVVIAASGSSRHAGLAAEVWLEELSRPSSQGNSACLVISQSGETTDTLGALRQAKEHRWKTLAVTNAAKSSMAREADIFMPIDAGMERAIPATKSFTSQLAALYILALYEGKRAGMIGQAKLAPLVAALWAQCAQIEKQLPRWHAEMAKVAKKYSGASSFLFLGGGIHYAIAREGALKLKEASYVPAEGYPIGELRHGPNALVSDEVPLVAIATYDPNVEASAERREKTLRLLRDLKTQGAKVIALANEGDKAIGELVTECVAVERAAEHLLPLSEVVPLQLFAYFMALERGIDMDRPRHLSKAVVENRES
jgi:glutamine---fructose-6-phosphate transaminase (isomerizing)